VKTELARLQPGEIIIAGGPAAVSNAVMSQLEAYDTGGGVIRVYGADRYGTAAALSKFHFPTPPAGHIAYVTTGSNFPDAIGAGPVAARRGAPIILVRSTSVPEVSAAELNRLNIRRIILLGGAKAVSMGVHSQLERYASGG
jgi:putative cell wall-binding protein